jgi:hypothetical protein
MQSLAQVGQELQGFDAALSELVLKSYENGELQDRSLALYAL